MITISQNEPTNDDINTEYLEKEIQEYLELKNNMNVTSLEQDEV